MRLAIINITGGGMSGGYKKYLANIVPRIAANKAVKEVLLILPEGLNLSGIIDEISKVKSIRYNPRRFPPNSLDKHIREYIIKFNPDVIFFPAARPVRFKGTTAKTIVMLQNMEPYVERVKENSMLENIRLLMLAIYGRKAMQRTDIIIAISDFVQKTIATRFGIDPKKIEQIYMGVDEAEVSCSPSTRLLLHIGNKFIFTAGIISPARGLEDLIQAIVLLRERGEKIPQVVIAGHEGKRTKLYREKLEKTIIRNGLNSSVIWLGQLNSEEMAWCYSKCEAFIMTSRVEACPNIALEAMSYGCSIIAANNPPLPELFGNTAMYYCPEKAHELADAIQYLMEASSEDKERYRKKAIERARGFSWNEAAEKTLQLFIAEVDKDN